MAQKPRILQDGRDLVWSLIPLLVIALIVAGVSGSCSWGFGNSATEQKIPSFNVSAGLHADAESMPFPIREPKLPANWKANSGSTQEIGATLSSNVGWITPNGVYIQLTQTAATEEQLVPKLLGDGASGGGVREISGQRWVTYSGDDHRKAWIADMGDVRVGVVSRGEDSDMQTLAKAVTEAEPLPSKRP
ncbi:DUF4245 domain-containing protein [Gordonia sihwensis]|uniref:DUF4245 domain-containing protein n=1 Tax=Gordonia sihwensis TaxID=173559 RepID=UPI0005EF3042|nr:DUF4245 domain-containing protein [Gordonia sihwensis]KJR04848.1 hypothetical protein UG54_18235 [Gordonia sihwensis]MBY4570261.1 hypothetical protein [Gordonia sihwensis]